MGYVDCYGNVGVDGVGGSCRAARADFLLRGADADKFVFKRCPFGGESAQGFENCERARFVVKGAGSVATVGHFNKRSLVDDGVADADEFFRLRLVCRTDVNPDLVGFGHFLALFGVHKMDCTFARDARDCAAVGQNQNPPARYHNVVVPAELLEEDEAVGVDVGNLQADFVDVACEHKLFCAAAEGGYAVAENVALEGVGNWFDVFFDYRGSLGFGARGRTGLQ